MKVIKLNKNRRKTKITSLKIQMNIQFHANITSIISLENNEIITGTSEGSIQLFSLNIRTKTFALQKQKYGAHEGDIWSFCELKNPNINNIISCSFDKTIKIWIISKNIFHLLKILTIHKHPIYKLIILPESRIASTSWDRTIKIFDSFDTYQTLVIIVNNECVWSMISLKNKDILVTSHDGVNKEGYISFWCLKKFQIIKSIKGSFARMPTHMIELPDGNIAISSYTEVKPISIIDTDRLIVQKHIISNYLNWNSSLCCFDKSSFVYLYNGKLLQISTKEYKIVSFIVGEKKLSGIHGFIHLQTLGLFAVIGLNEVFIVEIQ